MMSEKINATPDSSNEIPDDIKDFLTIVVDELYSSDTKPDLATAEGRSKVHNFLLRMGKDTKLTERQELAELVLKPDRDWGELRTGYIREQINRLLDGDGAANAGPH